MNNDVKVSIIVPIYMVEEYLRDCVNSILNQTYPNLEIILVDDGSKDHSPSIVDEYARMDKRVKAVHKDNGGLVSARKAGINNATGEYIYNLDGDDSIEIDCIEKLLKVALDEDADVVTERRMFRGNGKYAAGRIPTGVYRSPKEKQYLYENMLSCGALYSFGIMPFVCGKLFKKSVLMPWQVRVDDSISVGEDVICVYPALLSAKCIAISSSTGYIYRDRDDSLSSTRLAKPDETFEHLAFRYKEMKKIYQSIPDYYDVMLKQLNEYAYFAVVSKYPELLFSPEDDSFLPLGINKKDKTVIYGTGEFGTKLKLMLEKHGFENVLFFVDRDAYPYSEAMQMTKLLDTDFDKVCLATIRNDIADEMCSYIKDMRIDLKKVSRLRFDKEICEHTGSLLEAL